MPKAVMSFATYSFQELGYIGHTAVTRWSQSFFILLSVFFTSALQIAVHDSKKKKKKQKKKKPSNTCWPHPLQVNVILIISHSKKKKKIISMFFSPGVPNGLSTNRQFPYSQRSQFPPSSRIMKSYGKNDFTSTYPFCKHTVRNRPCVCQILEIEDIKPGFIYHEVYFWKEKCMNCNFELVC